MERSLFSMPDEFSCLPLLAVLPREGDVAALSRLTPALYARFEKAAMLKRAFQEKPDEPMPARVRAEDDMLRTVLEWLNVSLPATL
jgi:hypothetical protein